jgi:hypothetical protein
MIDVAAQGAPDLHRVPVRCGVLLRPPLSLPAGVPVKQLKRNQGEVTGQMN